MLRRLNENMKQQNWAAIGIELVILVLGVFIGMQVSNWNEEREARNDYLLAIERYRAEIVANIEVLDSLFQLNSNSGLWYLLLLCHNNSLCNNSLALLQLLL